MLERLRAAYRRISQKLRERRKARDKQREREREAQQGARHAAERRRELLAELDKTEAGEHEKRERLRVEIAELHRKAERRESRAHRARERAGELRSKIAWGLKRRTTLRRKIKRAKAEAHPKPASWQANGHEWHNLTAPAKQLLAYAVVTYDLACTSITRSWGTGSFHEEVPTRGFDSAGARMSEFQNDLRNGRVGSYDLADLLELFGPINDACADNGRPYVMAEGSSLETLHDNHVHSFVYGS